MPKLTEVRGAIYDGLAALTWPGTAPDVVYGLPLETQDEDLVAVLGMSDIDESTAALGPAAPRELQWLQEVAVDVYDSTAGDGPAERKALDQRAFGLVDTVRDWVVGDPTLGGRLRRFEPVSIVTDGLAPAAEGGWGIVVRLRIRCAVRI